MNVLTRISPATLAGLESAISRSSKLRLHSVEVVERNPAGGYEVTAMMYGAKHDRHFTLSKAGRRWHVTSSTLEPFEKNEDSAIDKYAGEEYYR